MVDHKSVAQGARRARKGFAPVSGSNRATRIRVFGALCLVWLGVIVWRLAELQLSSDSQWLNRSQRQHTTEITISSARGTIFDREKRMLAVSVPAGSVFVRPRQVRDKATTAQLVAETLGLPVGDVRKSLESTKPFVWIARQVPRVFADRITALNITGVGSMLESRRFYPYNHAASTLIGKVGVDGFGLSGIERRYEDQLHGQHHTDHGQRDALGNFISMGDPARFVELPKGANIELTIDAVLQTTLQEELERGRASANAKEALGVMVDAYSGEVLALGHAPSVNFNVASRHTKSDLAEPVLESVFEPGSVMKPFVAAAAMQEGLVTSSELIDCESGRLSFGGHLIKDVHPIKSVSFYDVVVQSSNIGMTKVGARLGSDRLFEYLDRFGFGRSLGLGLPGETRGILRPVSSWARVDLATHSFGHGMAVTPLQVVRAFSSLVNDGVMPELSIIKSGTGNAARGVRVLRPEVTGEVRRMLIGAVEEAKGTGGKARIDGAVVGGKTGTAQVPSKDGRGYAPGAYIASFVGFAEVPEVRLPFLPVLMISIVEPDTTSIYGGTLAAPVFQRVMKRTLSHLGAKSEWRGPGTLGPSVIVPDLAPEVRKNGVVPASFRM